MSKACESVSLSEYPCVKPAGHDRDHERYDGRTWPEGQTWGDVIAEYFRSQGIDPEDHWAVTPKTPPPSRG